MVDRSTIINPFFRELYNQLAPEIDRRMVELASGSAKQIVGSTETVAESYARQCAYLEALNEVLKVCSNIEHNLHGNRPEEQQRQE